MCRSASGARVRTGSRARAIERLGGAKAVPQTEHWNKNREYVQSCGLMRRPQRVAEAAMVSRSPTGTALNIQDEAPPNALEGRRQLRRHPLST